MAQIMLKILFLTVFLLSFTSGSDEDENFYFANNNNKFFYNSRKNCQPNNYFDVDFFKCRLCDPNFNLIATQQSEFGGWVLNVMKRKCIAFIIQDLVCRVLNQFVYHQL